MQAGRCEKRANPNASRPPRSLHAKFIFSANHRENSDICNSAWLYLGSGNLTGPGFANQMASQSGNLEAGVVFTPESLRWSPAKGIPPESVLTNLLPLQWETDFSENPGSLAAGSDMPDPEMQYSAAPVAYFFWIVEEDISWLRTSEEITESFDLLDDDGSVCQRDPIKGFPWRGPRPRQVQLRWCVGGQERRAWVPVIDEFGRIAATILPRIDIEEAWSQLANFPMPPDEEELLADGNPESTDDAAQQGSGASTTASYPVRQMMQLVENIAAKQISVSKADWVTWCTRLEQCLIQAAGSKVLEEFLKLESQPPQPVVAQSVSPRFCEQHRNSGRPPLRERAQTGGNCLESGRSRQIWGPAMNQIFQGWEAVAEHLRQQADLQDQLALKKGEDATHLNPGQRASLRAIASRILRNGVVIADEVGMGKTRIAVEVARCVIKSGGRVAILVPPGLGYQWQAELRDGEINDVPPILRSLGAYLRRGHDNQQPWFAKQTVMVSHAFTNWRLSENAAVWRWALVPELYARWRDMTDRRLPRGYHGNPTLAKGWACGAAAKSIVRRFTKEP